MKRLKIAIVTPHRHYYGGVEVFNAMLEGILSDHEITYVTLDETFPQTFLEKLSCKFLTKAALTKKRFMQEHEEFDVVICNGEYGFGVHHPRSINIFHGCASGYRAAIYPFISWKDRFLLSCQAYIQKLSAKKKYVVTVSSFLKDIMVGQGVNVDKVIANCVDSSVFYPDKEIPRNDRCLFVGSPNYHAKGFDILEDLARKGFSVDCVTSKNLSPSLNVLPCRDAVEIAKLYRQYRILLFPSRFEGAGLISLEAMACGLPVITTTTGLGIEIKKSIPEFVVDVNTAEEYHRKIQVIEKDYDRFSSRALEYVRENHSFENFSQRWRDTILSLANNDIGS
jgi:glycosyltransferase involved in cell wall biosynthesis